jgi:hypothetical protein
MKEIKFRFRTDATNEMLYGEPALRVLYHNLENKIPVMQFTWLLDKNWKEIYEWDIVKCSSGCPHIIKRVDDMWWTYWWWMPWFVLDGLKRNCWEWYAWTWEEEVIWDIYSNPELLPT